MYIIILKLALVHKLEPLYNISGSGSKLLSKRHVKYIKCVDQLYKRTAKIMLGYYCFSLFSITKVLFLNLAKGEKLLGNRSLGDDPSI